MYEYLDEVLEALVQQIYQTFADYKALPFDELNVFSRTSQLYTKLTALNKTAFRRIAKHYYNSEHHPEDTDIDDDWLVALLAEPSKVIKYAYTPEIMRKRDRLTESLTAAVNRKRDGQTVTADTVGSAEYDTAMRYWTQMTGWFGLEVADAALHQNRKDDGVTFVRWVTQHDTKVCDECKDRDNQVYMLDDVPDKPHPNCRCKIVRVDDK